MACEPNDWEAAAERLNGAFDRGGRQAELDEILRAHPAPAGAPPLALPPAASPTTTRFESDPAIAPDSSPTPRLTRARTTGRNDPCPCGSGRKYKKCCLV
jgi:hypothetical protein